MNTQFFTGVGDTGESQLGQKRISKDNPLFDVLGAFDELNAFSGWCVVEAGKIKKDVPRISEIEENVKELQEMMFIAQAEIASLEVDLGPLQKITLEKIERLNEIIKKVDSELPPITKFIIPGESELGVRLDMARVRARDAERVLVHLGHTKEIQPELLSFANRLSSVYFALARFANFLLGEQEKNPSYK
ncbi:MAG: cob(I)yrinic acid a,c-diamide adenosyltransferase [Candidatus Jorgensenbacteria bacterium]|nr:cob(I)yrinic acid a,c-diamide adenosyltransferase [Candidatus Jorgensenbacteria bacterium]